MCSQENAVDTNTIVEPSCTLTIVPADGSPVGVHIGLVSKDRRVEWVDWRHCRTPKDEYEFCKEKIECTARVVKTIAIVSNLGLEASQLGSILKRNNVTTVPIVKVTLNRADMEPYPNRTPSDLCEAIAKKATGD